ncbi:hypothetical protein [Pedobacter sp. MW01-1-1]|uniref:hypothetical protein n=1 Tax=Pedobacter sp. MW01-1-1 TaxID=3383027 RepID=UPI003FF00D72
MIIKLDRPSLRLSHAKLVREKKVAKPLTKEAWVIADRVVISVLFGAAIAGAIFLN